jgi:hypothetical protein
MATGPTANRPLTKTFCEACRQVFTPKDAMQIYQNKYYHPQCFCCSNCGNSIAGKAFYPKPNDQFQCENCNNSLAPTYVRSISDFFNRKNVLHFIVVVCVIKRFNQVQQQSDFRIVIIMLIASGNELFFVLNDSIIKVLFL